MHTVRVVIDGHVQGVGFRYFVRQSAEEAGVRGRVWNRRDGRVEAELGHPDFEVLLELVRSFENGPGRVSNVSRFDENLNLSEPGFVIGPTT